MVLITMTTSFAVPKIRSSLFSNELRATARRFIGLVADTGQEARSKRTGMLLRFDRQRSVFTTASESDTSPQDDSIKRYSEVKVPESIQVVDVTSAHGGTKNLGELDIYFSSKGYVDKTIVHFRDNSGDELSVILSPFLGVTRVREGYVSLENVSYTSDGS